MVCSDMTMTELSSLATAASSTLYGKCVSSEFVLYGMGGLGCWGIDSMSGSENIHELVILLLLLQDSGRNIVFLRTVSMSRHFLVSIESIREN